MWSFRIPCHQSHQNLYGEWWGGLMIGRPLAAVDLVSPLTWWARRSELTREWARSKWSVATDGLADDSRWWLARITPRKADGFVARPATPLGTDGADGGGQKSPRAGEWDDAFGRKCIMTCFKIPFRVWCQVCEEREHLAWFRPVAVLTVFFSCHVSAFHIVGHVLALSLCSLCIFSLSCHISPFHHVAVFRLAVSTFHSMFRNSLLLLLKHDGSRFGIPSHSTVRCVCTLYAPTFDGDQSIAVLFLFGDANWRRASDVCDSHHVLCLQLQHFLSFSILYRDVFVGLCRVSGFCLIFQHPVPSLHHFMSGFSGPSLLRGIAIVDSILC